MKPFGTEIRPRSSRLGKDIGTPLPRAALFDRTNEHSKDKEEPASKDVTDQSSADTIAAARSEGTTLIEKAAVETKVTAVPFEDNIVKQLLEEYTALQEDLEAEMHTTPLRSQPLSDCKEPDAAKAEDPVPQPAKDHVAVQKVIQQSIAEEMLITPQRTESGQVPSDVPTDTTPATEAEAKVTIPDIPAPVLETDINAAPANETDAIKEEDGAGATLKSDNGDRWEMDGSPFINEKVPMATKTSKHTLKSEVKPTTPFDPRSLRQIKQELKAMASKPNALPGLPCDSEASDTTMYTGAICAAEAEESEEASSALCKALDDLMIAPKAAATEPLRGVPVAAGRHMRFTEEGDAIESPTADRTLLRGIPAPAGSHLRFDE